MPSTAIASFRDIQQALAVVRPTAHHTPMLTSQQLSETVGCTVKLKAENLQRTGSFKIRGALSKLASLSFEERARGIIAASAGNHAQGVALAAREAGVSCTVVMPTGASLAKVQATRGYGAEVILHGDNLEETQRRAREISQRSGLTYIHPFDDAQVVAGQGTLGIEICHDAPDATVVLVPIGGGGLIGGVALAVKTLAPTVRIVGVQAASSPAAERSFRRHRRLRLAARPTLADGIAVARPGSIPWRLIRRHVDRVVTVGEEAIAHAQVLLLERAKLVVEGAGAVGVAALLEGAVQVDESDTVVALLSGGNVDLNLVSRILEHGLAGAGRYQLIQAEIPDTPGQLARLLAALAEVGVNVLDVDHLRRTPGLPLGRVLVEVTGETRHLEHAQEVVVALEKAGYALHSVPVRGSGEAIRFVAQ